MVFIILSETTSFWSCSSVLNFFRVFQFKSRVILFLFSYISPCDYISIFSHVILSFYRKLSHFEVSHQSHNYFCSNTLSYKSLSYSGSESNPRFAICFYRGKTKILSNWRSTITKTNIFFFFSNCLMMQCQSISNFCHFTTWLTTNPWTPPIVNITKKEFALFARHAFLINQKIFL